jgi:hypothetical protein
MKQFYTKTLALAIFGLVSFLGNLGNAQVQAIDASGPSVCDGAAYVIDDSTATNVVWQSNGVVIATGTTWIDSLCPGNYVVTYNNPNSQFFTFTINGNGNPCAGFSATMSTVNTTDVAFCDGSATITLTGGTAPYTYSWNGPVGNMATMNGLCIGTYTCAVVDANGCNTSAFGIVYADSTNSGNDSTLFITNNNFPGANVIGTSTNTYEDCTLDFGAVGSASATSITNISVGTNPSGLDTMEVVWTVMDTMNNVMATYTTYYLVSDSLNGVVNFMFIVHCSQKAMNYNTLVISENLMVGPLAIGEENLEFSIVNPVTENLNIQFAANEKGSLLLLNANGQVVKTASFDAKEVHVSVSELSAGMYFVHLNTVHGTKTVKILR